MIGTAQGYFLSWYVVPELAKNALGVSQNQTERNYMFTTVS